MIKKNRSVSTMRINICIKTIMALAMICTIALAQENTPEYWIDKGQALIGEQSLNESIIAFDNAIKFANSSQEQVAAWRGKAIALQEMGKLPEAIEANRMAIELNPRELDIWSTQGFLFAELGRYNESIESYDMAIQTEPDKVSDWIGRADALDSIGRSDEAVKDYKRNYPG